MEQAELRSAVIDSRTGRGGPGGRVSEGHDCSAEQWHPAAHPAKSCTFRHQHSHQELLQVRSRGLGGSPQSVRLAAAGAAAAGALALQASLAVARVRALQAGTLALPLTTTMSEWHHRCVCWGVPHMPVVLVSSPPAACSTWLNGGNGDRAGEGTRCSEPMLL